MNAAQDSREKRNFWYFALGFLLFFVVVILIPHPSDFQQRGFRWFASIMSAGVGYNIPGFLSLEYRTKIGKGLNLTIKAGGAIAIFVIVYLVDPTGLVHSK